MLNYREGDLGFDMGILVVDDSKFMRNIIKGILGKNNIKVIGEASNGKEAVEKYRELKPEVVTMDLTMSEMSGLDAVEKIVSIDPEAKIIVCSAMGQQAIVKEAIEAGAKGFLVKPFDENNLIEEVSKLLKTK